VTPGRRHGGNDQAAVGPSTATAMAAHMLAQGCRRWKPLGRGLRWAQLESAVPVGQSGMVSWPLGRGAIWARGAEGDFNSFSIFRNDSNHIQTSKIQIKFNIHPKFMKSILLFF
jgi:hypothetical protein